MKRFNYIALLSAVIGIGLPALAHAELLAGEEITETIDGKRVVLELSSFGIDFSMFHRENGEVTGDGSGTDLGSYFAPKETGNWWVSGEKMCQQFPTWYDGKRLCFKLRKVTPKRCEWIREDGKRGTAITSG